MLHSKDIKALLSRINAIKQHVLNSNNKHWGYINYIALSWSMDYLRFFREEAAPQPKSESNLPTLQFAGLMDGNENSLALLVY